jgi:hypothetical protein
VGARLITGKQIRNSSITGKDVKDSSLTKKDFMGAVRRETRHKAYCRETRYSATHTR